MAQFKRNNATLKKRTRKKRKFVKKKDPQKKVLKSVSSKADKSPTDAQKPEPKEKKEKVSQETQQINKNTPPKSTSDANTELDSINRMIKEASAKLNQIEEQKAQDLEDKPEIVDTPEAFNGVSDEDERLQLIEQKLHQELKRSNKLTHELSIVKDDFEEEKAKLEQNIRDLKRDMHRSKPITNSTFFSVSKELDEAVEMMDGIATASAGDEKTDVAAAAPPPAPTAAKKDAEVSKREDERDEKKVVKKDPESEIKKEESMKPKKKRNKKKVMITGMAAVAVLVLFSWVLTTRFGGSEVDEELVAEYLEKQGQVAGTSNEAEDGESDGDGSDQSEGSDSTTLIQESDFAEAKANVPYDQTRWKALDEGMFGIHIEYPENAVNILKTDSNYTFLRHDGYIFKVQKIETALEPQEYWKQIKATSLNYAVEEVEFKEWTALKLSLEELIKFPGDRYFVKVGDNIFDVWYATPSNDFDDDDVRRAKRMLDSLTFIE